MIAMATNYFRLASCGLLLSSFAPRKNEESSLSRSERRHLFTARCLATVAVFGIYFFTNSLAFTRGENVDLSTVPERNLAQQSVKYIPIGDKIELNLGGDPEVIFELIKRRFFRSDLNLQIHGTNEFRKVGDDE